MTLPDCVVHGGPDALGSVPHDFSTNANAAGPCPFVQERLQTLVADRYPDPAHAAVIERLAAMHEVSPARIIIGTSASELIMRITAAMMRLHGPQVQVRVPVHAYGDYARAARAWGLHVSAWGRPVQRHVQSGAQASPGAGETTADPGARRHDDRVARDDRRLHVWSTDRPTLTWVCDPDSPFGKSPRHDADTPAAAPDTLAVQILDRVYAPLQLAGQQPDPTGLDRVWQLHSPNKALGLCGVRGGYLIAPHTLSDSDEALCSTLRALAPSWPLGVHAVALLEAWTEADTRQWLRESLIQLRSWKSTQVAGLQARGWRVYESQTSFFCAEPPPMLPGGSRADPVGREENARPPAEDALHAPFCGRTALVRGIEVVRGAENPDPRQHGRNATGDGQCPADFPARLPDSCANSHQRLQQHLRSHGIKLRETGSFGLPGAFRLCVHHPRSQKALWHALDNFHD